MRRWLSTLKTRLIDLGVFLLAMGLIFGIPIGLIVLVTMAINQAQERREAMKRYEREHNVRFIMDLDKKWVAVPVADLD